jgi:hypothetical protein
VSRARAPPSAGPPPRATSRPRWPRSAPHPRAPGSQGESLFETWVSIRADLGALEAEFTSLRGDLALAGAPAELDARMGEVRQRLDALRALENELDRIVAEDPSAERPEQ